ncbi:hypothetical protein M5689_002956 [Euphorbia peplus]|nr:hypothetical protein M5689_002956 [Euphorbia peplus]
MRIPPGSKPMRLTRKPRLKKGFKQQQQNLLNNPVLKTRVLRIQQSSELCFGEEFGGGFIVRATDELMGLVIPSEAIAKHIVLEGMEGKRRGVGMRRI